MKVSALFEAWLCLRNKKLKINSQVKYEKIAEKWILPSLGEVAIEQLCQRDIKRFYDKLNTARLSPNSQAYIIRLFSAFWKANRNNIVGPSKNLDLNFVMPRTYKVTKEGLSFLDSQKLQKYLLVRTDAYSLAVLLALFTGMRLGEVCALQFRDIDFERRTLSVNRTLFRMQALNGNRRTRLMLGSPKTQSSCREIPLQRDLICRLMALNGNKDDFVFGGAKPMDPRTLQNHFKKILKEAGIAETNFHALRHTFATQAIGRGNDARTLCDVLGHSDVKITLARYVHPSMEMKRILVDSIFAEGPLLRKFYKRNISKNLQIVTWL